MTKIINLKHDDNLKQRFREEGQRFEEERREHIPSLEEITTQAESTQLALENYQETVLAKEKDDTFHYGETTEIEKDTTLSIAETAKDDASAESDQTIEAGALGTYIKVMIQRAWSEMTNARATLKEMFSLRSQYMLLAVHPSTDNLDDRIELLEHGYVHAEEMSKSVAALGIFGSRALVAMEMFHQTHPELSKQMLAELADEYRIWANENLDISFEGDYNFLALYKQILASITGDVSYAELGAALQKKKQALQLLKEGQGIDQDSEQTDPFEELDEVDLEIEVDTEDESNQPNTKAA